MTAAGLLLLAVGDWRLAFSVILNEGEESLLRAGTMYSD